MSIPFIWGLQRFISHYLDPWILFYPWRKINAYQNCHASQQKMTHFCNCFVLHFMCIKMGDALSAAFLKPEGTVRICAFYVFFFNILSHCLYFQKGTN